MSKFLSTTTSLLVCLTVLISNVCAQEGSENQPTSGPAPQGAPANVRDSAIPRDSTRSSALVIGPGDELQITVYGATDLSPKVRVSSDGNISLPLVGYVQLAGLTSDQAEQAIAQQLRQRNIIKDPQVSVFVAEYTNEGISVAGEVSKPGVYPALGSHRLLDVLQMAGGPTEKAGTTVSISHRGQDQVQTIELSDDHAQMARSNIDLQPGDTVVVSRAGVVYVLGEVNKPGGYVLNSTGGVTVLKVVAADGGPTHVAALGGVKMVRRTPTGLKEMPIPLKDLLRAKVADIPLQPDDVVYVPSSRTKSILSSGALLTNIGTASIYRIPF